MTAASPGDVFGPPTLITNGDLPAVPQPAVPGPGDNKGTARGRGRGPPSPWGTGTEHSGRLPPAAPSPCSHSRTGGSRKAEASCSGRGLAALTQADLGVAPLESRLHGLRLETPVLTALSTCLPRRSVTRMLEHMAKLETLYTEPPQAAGWTGRSPVASCRVAEHRTKVYRANVSGARSSAALSTLTKRGHCTSVAPQNAVATPREPGPREQPPRPPPPAAATTDTALSVSEDVPVSDRTRCDLL